MAKKNCFRIWYPLCKGCSSTEEASLDIDAARHDLWSFAGFTCRGATIFLNVNPCAVFSNQTLLSAVDAAQCQE